jgi:phage shock protein PspC (stress-responsive transcriptional regulator)
MTETTYASPRLERPRDSAIAGVCTALARTTGTDPVLWRVLAVVLTFFGGIGVVLYVVGVVAIPKEGEQQSLAERLLRGPDRHLSRTQVLLVALVVVMVAGGFTDANGILTIGVLGALGVLWWRGRTEHVRTPPASTQGASKAELTQPPGAADPTALLPDVPTREPLPARPPRPRSPLTALTASAAVLVAGALLLIGATGGGSIPAEVVLAGALATVGVGLVAGSFFGRSAGLISVAVLLSVALGVTAGVRPAIDAGVGDRTWLASSGAQYRLGIGQGTLDLSTLPTTGGPADITARVDVGHLLVVVPEGLRVSVDARAGIGNVQLFGTDYDGRGIDRHADFGPPGVRQATLHLSVRTGMVEVRRG